MFLTQTAHVFLNLLSATRQPIAKPGHRWFKKHSWFLIIIPSHLNSNIENSIPTILIRCLADIRNLTAASTLMNSTVTDVLWVMLRSLT